MKIQIRFNAFFYERVIVAIFFLYLEWYKEVWGDNHVVLYGTVALLTGLVCLQMVRDRYFEIQAMPSLLKTYFAYFFYSFSGIFIALDVSYMMSGLTTYLCFVVVCFDCWYVSSKLGNHDWLYNIFKCVAIICAFQVIFHGQPFWNGIYVTTMSSTNNPNTLGLILVIGILSFSLTTNQEKTMSFAFSLIANTAMLYGIVLSGSRKCLLSACAVFAFWMLTYIRAMIRQRRYKQLLLVLGCIFIGIYICLFYVGNYFQSSAAYERLTRLFQEGGTEKREDLYREAYIFFKTSPLIGIGFKQYELWSSYGLYSHSSYAEVLSCSGIIGILIFYIPMAKCLYNCIKNALSKNFNGDRYRAQMIVLFFLCELFIGVGQIFTYDVLHLVVLMMISMEKSSMNPCIYDGSQYGRELFACQS